ncbi:hypothetical protein [Streptomyces sp. SudanB182_2057]
MALGPAIDVLAAGRIGIPSLRVSGGEPVIEAVIAVATGFSTSGTH